MPDDKETPDNPAFAGRAGLAAKETVQNEIEADSVVDEYGGRIAVPREKIAAGATHGEPTIGGTGPTNWWRTGLLIFGLLIVLLLILQWMTGVAVAPREDAAQSAPTAQTQPVPPTDQ